MTYKDISIIVYKYNSIHVAEWSRALYGIF